jgi:tyrosine-protein phosphatase YwqE
MIFQSRRNPSTDYRFLAVDMHNHVLPALDDGAPDTATSLQLMAELKKLGFSTLIPTPHTYSSLYPNTPGTIEAAYRQLQQTLALQDESLYPVLQGYASEYMLDNQYTEERKMRQPLSFGKRRVLIEMSFADLSPMLHEEIFQLQLHGQVPVLAHPERYPYLFGHLGYFEQLIALGCELQLNLLSLTDHYGPGPQKTARLLLKNELYSWAGTDAHHMGHIELLKELLQSKALSLITEYPFLNRELTT